MGIEPLKRWNPIPKGPPDLKRLEGTVAPEILEAMRAASEQLTRSGIRHALIGALAVGAYGYVRATKDVDFLVGPEAFQEHAGGIITFAPGVPLKARGVAIDPIPMPADAPHLEEAVDRPLVSEDIPVSPFGAVVYLKLRSPRKKDAADLVELFKAGASEKEARKYLSKHAPELLPKLEAILEETEEETQ